jgi:hypothetical protein
MVSCSLLRSVRIEYVQTTFLFKYIRSVQQNQGLLFSSTGAKTALVDIGPASSIPTYQDFPNVSIIAS